MTPDYALGVDLGGTNVKILAVTAQGRVLRQEHFPTPDNGSEGWAEPLARWIRRIQDGLGPYVAVGVACPGLVADDGRGIQWMAGRLPWIVGVDWTALLRCHVAVRVINDAHAALLGEAWLGAARGRRNVVLLTLGTGVGGAMICDGRLLRGHLGRAGHLGHITLDPCGKKDIVQTPGSLEDAIGECTLPQRGNGRYPNTETLVKAAEAGDVIAQEIWRVSVRAMAAGIASIINVIDPELLVLGGGMAKAGAALLVPLREFLDEFEWRPTRQRVGLELAQLGDHAGAFGAARNALDQGLGCKGQR